MCSLGGGVGSIHAFSALGAITPEMALIQTIGERFGAIASRDVPIFVRNHPICARFSTMANARIKLDTKKSDRSISGLKSGIIGEGSEEIGSVSHGFVGESEHIELYRIKARISGMAAILKAPPPLAWLRRFALTRQGSCYIDANGCRFRRWFRARLMSASAA